MRRQIRRNYRSRVPFQNNTHNDYETRHKMSPSYAGLIRLKEVCSFIFACFWVAKATEIMKIQCHVFIILSFCHKERHAPSSLCANFCNPITSLQEGCSERHVTNSHNALESYNFLVSTANSWCGSDTSHFVSQQIFGNYKTNNFRSHNASIQLAMFKYVL